MLERDGIDRRNILKISSGAMVLPLLSGCLGDSGDDGGDRTDGADADGSDPSSDGDHRGGAGYAEPGAKVREVTHVYNTEQSGPWMEEFQLQVAEFLEDIGFRMNPNRLPFGEQVAELVDPALTEFEMSTFNLNSIPNRAVEPWTVMMRFHSENPVNLGGVSDEIIDENIEQAEGEMDPDQRASYYKTAQERASEIVTELAPVFSNYIDAHNAEEWTGFVPTPGGGGSSDDWEWTFFNVEPTGNRDTFIAGTVKEHDSTNPFVSQVMQQRSRLLYDSMLRVTEDLEIIPWAATDIEYSDDGTAVDFTIREGMTFHDGVEVTAEDVVFTMNYLKTHQQGTQNVMVWEPAVGAPDSEVIDEYVARIHLNESTAGYDTFRGLRFRIYPKHQWEGEDQEQFSPDTPIGSGPFQWADWDRGSRTIFDAYPDHWSEYPKVERLIWTEIPSVDGLIGALESGQIDAITEPLTPAQANNLQGMSAIQVVDTPRFIPVWMYFNFNTRDVFKDFELRQAIMHAINREQLVQGVLDGKGQKNPWNSRIHPNQERWFSAESPEYTYDPDLARSILSEAGYSWDDDGDLVYPDDRWGDYLERIENPNMSAEQLGQQ